MQSAIALIDANNFYVSCERIFKPGLIGRPVVVLSNNDGCIISRSEEAKELGIKMGAPLFKLRHIVEAYDVAVYSSNYALYGDMSHRLMEALQEFTPEVEIYSIDEAFMNLSGVDARAAKAQGLTIKKKVRQWTGIPVSIGVAPTKTLAKIAQRFAKKSSESEGVFDLMAEPERTAALEETGVEEIWGVGPAYSKLLKAAGISTARKLRDADRRWIRQRMTVVGARIVEELRGVRCLPLEECPPQKKSITCSRSLGLLVESLNELREAIALFMTKAAERLRRFRMAAGAVTVFINTDRFSTDAQYGNSITYELAYATDVTQELLDWAFTGLEKIYRSGYRYKKAGVLLSHLVPGGEISMRLFGDGNFERSRKVMKAVDEINRRYGRGTVHFGVEKPGARWSTKFMQRSPRYTTCLKDVMQVS